jgi:hypothetical protein
MSASRLAALFVVAVVAGMVFYRFCSYAIRASVP